MEIYFKKAEKIREAATQDSPSKPPPSKKQHFDQCSKMVEAMYERSLNYFKQFQKQFNVLIADEKPKLTALNNYAVCPHFKSQLPTNHFHVLIENAIDVETLKPIKTFAVPCLFTTFRHLLSNSTSLEFKGDTFSKLQLAVDFNNKSGEKMYASDFHPWQQRQTNNQNLQRSLAESQNIGKIYINCTTENNSQFCVFYNFFENSN